MFYNPNSLPNCPICLEEVEWVSEDPQDFRERKRPVPFCSHCGWFGTTLMADDSRKDREFGIEIRLVFALTTWVLLFSGVVIGELESWVALLIAALTIIPVFHFKFWYRDKEVKDLFKRMEKDQGNW